MVGQDDITTIFPPMPAPGHGLRLGLTHQPPVARIPPQEVPLPLIEDVAVDVVQGDRELHLRLLRGGLGEVGPTPRLGGRRSPPPVREGQQLRARRAPHARAARDKRRSKCTECLRHAVLTETLGPAG